MSDSLPSKKMCAYESAMRQYMDWIAGQGTKPPDSAERNGSIAKKIVTDVHSKNDSSMHEPGTSSGNFDTPVNQYHTKGSEKTVLPSKRPYGKEGADNAVKKTHSYNRGYFNAELFGSYQDVVDALAKPISSYSLLYEHPSIQKSFTHNTKKKVKVANCKALVGKHPLLPKSRPESKKNTWKETNRFPTNVRSLIGTGMLDGMAVQYVSLSHEKLRGIIKGSGYLCGCGSCNYSKTLNAYEFELHAGCKTSHPNNHIRFANGKTIHQIVQELKYTPANMLFDAIQSVTGSPINQSAFLVWKESYQAASRRIQRISAM
ncbi:hypothetical protein OROMI_030453 [Orobanche minor]